MPGKQTPILLHEVERDLGLNYTLSAIWLPFVRYYRSGFVALPFEGGWFDQDAAMMADFERLTALVNFHAHDLDQVDKGYAPGWSPDMTPPEPAEPYENVFGW